MTMVMAGKQKMHFGANQGTRAIVIGLSFEWAVYGYMGVLCSYGHYTTPNLQYGRLLASLVLWMIARGALCTVRCALSGACT
jgi:hypothetical protein